MATSRWAQARNVNVESSVVISSGTLILEPNLGGAGGSATLTSSVQADAVQFVGNGPSGNSLVLAGVGPSQVVVNDGGSTIAGYGGPVVSFSNLQTLTLNLTGASPANSLAVLGTSGNDRAIFYNAGAVAPTPIGPAPTTGSLQFFQITDIGGIQALGVSGDDDFENYTSTSSLFDGGTGHDTMVGGAGVNVMYGGQGGGSLIAGNSTATPLANYIYADYEYNDGDPIREIPPAGVSGDTVTCGTGNDLVIAEDGNSVTDLNLPTPQTRMSLTTGLSVGVQEVKSMLHAAALRRIQIRSSFRTAAS